MRLDDFDPNDVDVEDQRGKGGGFGGFGAFPDRASSLAAAVWGSAPLRC
jgi:hypothetical protein